MDFFHYTYLYANGYLDKFRVFFNNPGLTFQGLTAILKTFYKKKKWQMYTDDSGKHTIWRKDELNNILDNKFFYLPQIKKICFDKWDKNKISKEWENEPKPDYSSDAEDMNKVSQGLINNDNYGYGKVDESMKKNIYITENQLKHIIRETSLTKYFVEPNKVLVIKKYLDDNFAKGGIPNIGEDGYPSTMPIVALKGTDGQVARNMSDKQLFALLLDKFKNVYSDDIRKKRFLQQLMKDWYYDKISKEGLLSVNEY